MVDMIVSPEMWPFTIALLVVGFIFLLEIVGFLVGFSSFSDGGDFDIDIEPPVDVDAALEVAFLDASPDIDFDIDVSPDISVWNFLELGKVPMLVWILSVAGGFAMAGYGIQLVTYSVSGFMLPILIATAASIIPTVVIAKLFISSFVKIVPKASSQAITRSSLGGSVGNISIGVAEVDNPAPATVKDRYGNTHSIRVIPFEGESVLPQGTDIVVLRGENDGVFQALSLTSAKQRYFK